MNFYQIDYVSNTEVNQYPITGIEQEGNSDTRFTYDFSGANLSTTPSIGSAVDLVPPFHNQGPFGGQYRCGYVKVAAETSYYFFYVDSNSTSQFKRLNYGNDETSQGTETTIFNQSYHAPTIDYKRMKFYGWAGGTIREWDLTRSGGIVDNSSTYYTEHSGFASGQSSYASGDAVNNVYCVSQSNATYFRNLALSTGRGRIYNNAYNTSDRRTVLMYNSSEDRYYLLVGAQQASSGSTYFGYFEASEIATNETNNFTITKTDISTGNFRSYLNGRTGGNMHDHYASQWSRLDDNILAIPYSNTSWRLWKCEGGHLVYMNIEVSGTQSTDTTYWNNLIPYGEINQTNTNLPYTAYTGISTKLRTQGVEIT